MILLLDTFTLIAPTTLPALPAAPAPPPPNKHLHLGQNPFFAAEGSERPVCGREGEDCCQ
jgi:hypothetical protein